jgi:hypothetical protein
VKQASPGGSRATEATAGERLTISEEMVEEWAEIWVRFCNEVPMTEKEYVRWSHTRQLMQNEVEHHCLPHGRFRTVEGFRSSVDSIIRMMKKDIEEGGEFAPERKEPYDPFEGIVNAEDRVDLMDRCLSSLRGETDSTADRVIEVARFVMRELLSKCEDNSMMEIMGKGLRTAIEAHDYKRWLAGKKEAMCKSEPVTPEKSCSLCEDEALRVGDRPGAEAAGPSIGGGTPAPCLGDSPPLSPLPEVGTPVRHPGKRRLPVEEESDDEATFDAGLMHTLDLCRAAEVEGSLMDGVPGSHLSDLIERISLSCQTLAEFRSVAEPRPKRRNETVEEPTVSPKVLEDISKQVALLRGLIVEKHGRGVHRQVQDATRSLEEILCEERRARTAPQGGRPQGVDVAVQTAPLTAACVVAHTEDASVVDVERTTGVPIPAEQLASEKPKKKAKEKKRKRATAVGPAPVLPGTPAEAQTGQGIPQETRPARMAVGADPAKSSWAEVAGRMRKRKKKEETAETPKPSPPTRGPAAKQLRSKVPRTEAVVIGPLKEGQKYAVVMQKAMATVDPLALGIQVSGTRRTQTGAVLLEVRGPAAHADLLASKLGEALKELDVRVHRPSKTCTVLLLDVEEWVGEADVHQALSAALASSDAEPPHVGPVMVRANIGGKGRYARCEVPIRVASRLATLGRVRVGWTSCRLRILNKGPQCYRCLERGHIAHACKGPDRSKACFRCKEEGHLVKECPVNERPNHREVLPPPPRGATRATGLH